MLYSRRDLSKLEVLASHVNTLHIVGQNPFYLRLVEMQEWR
jgi:hypothetical protein